MRVCVYAPICRVLGRVGIGLGTHQLLDAAIVSTSPMVSAAVHRSMWRVTIDVNWCPMCFYVESVFVCFSQNNIYPYTSFGNDRLARAFASAIRSNNNTIYIYCIL